MIESSSGVISTTSDNYMHMGWLDERDEWRTCQTPYHQHRRPDGEWLSCAEAAKFAHHNMMGVRTLSQRKPAVKEGPNVGINVPVNLPR